MKMKIIFNKIKYIILPGIFLTSFPSVLFSQTWQTSVSACVPDSFSLVGSDFKCTIYRIIGLVNLLVPVMFGGAFIVFFWGLSKFILHSGSPAEVTKGKSYMLWGVIALFVLVTVRAIIALVATNIIGSPGVIPVLPTNLP